MNICVVELFDDGESLGIDMFEVSDLRHLSDICISQVESHLQRTGRGVSKNPGFTVLSIF